MNLVLLLSLLATAVIVTLLILLRMKGRRRELLEDALKHLYNCEYTGVSCTLDSLAGSLGRQRDRAASVMNELSARSLMILDGNELKLTPSGREYALKIIRVHRLWERHLSDETGVPEVDWHKKAEAKEHRLKAEEVHELSRRLGHPVYDPHGDPIPSETGSIPSVRGRSLHTFGEGEVVTISHVEDEPSAVYAQIVSLDLHPGMSLRVLRKTEEKIVVEKEGKTKELTLAAAGNLRVTPGRRSLDTGPQKTLATLQPGEEGTVRNISHSCRGLQRRRLMDLGIVPGTKVGVAMRSVSGDPTAYTIRGGMVALRREQAEMIYLQ